MIPFVDLKAQYASIRTEVNAAIQGILDSCQFTLGSEVAAFEEEFAAYSQSKFGIGVNTGTSALHLALLAAGVGPGDEVITTDSTCVASALPIAYTGATAVFVDIDPARSYFSKQTLVVERDLLRAIGGFDESLAALPYTELFLRLNAVCSILGLPEVTYRQYLHDGSRLSRDPSRRRLDYDRLVARHRDFFAAHPRAFAEFTLRQARALYAFGDRRGAVAGLATILRRDPGHALRHIPPLVWRAVRERFQRPLRNRSSTPA